MSLITALELMKIDTGRLFPIIEESAKLAPEISVIPAETMAGTSMNLTVRTSLPSVGFRQANEGVTRSKSEYTNRTFETHILDHRVVVDKAELDAQPNRGVVLENHASGVIESSLRLLGSQMYYGTTFDSKGFPGLISQYAADSEHEVDAGGNSALTSVWFLRVGRETLQFLFGQNQTLRLAPWKEETVLDAESKEFNAFTSWMTGRAGFRLANRNAAVRIKNLEEDTNVLTGPIMRDAFFKFTEFGFEPNLILMNGRSQRQLTDYYEGKSNTGNRGTIMSDWEGIRIVRTASIVNGETI